MGLGASDLLLAFASILLFHKGQIAEKLPLYCIGLSYCTLFFSISFNSLPVTFSCWTCYQLERNLWLKWFPWKGYNRLLNPGYSDPCWMFSKPLKYSSLPAIRIFGALSEANNFFNNQRLYYFFNFIAKVNKYFYKKLTKR